MREDAALLNAVLAEPDSYGPRLAYAVWLRHGSGASVEDEARSELIKVQIELEQIRGEDRAWPDLARRERELLSEFQSAWEKPLRSLLVPSLRYPGSWLHAQLFGRGGTWGFRRGFVEQVLTTAAGFLQDDVQLFAATPLRQVVLTNSSAMVGALSANERLDQLRSLYLVSDAEFDEDMEFLAEAARCAGLAAMEFRFPRIDSEMSELLVTLRGTHSGGNGAERQFEEFPAWKRCSADERRRLKELASSPRFVQRLTEPRPTSEAELLAANEWVYLGDALRNAGVWAVAKTFHDLVGESGLCRRLALFKLQKVDHPALEVLRNSPYFHAWRTA